MRKITWTEQMIEQLKAEFNQVIESMKREKNVDEKFSFSHSLIIKQGKDAQEQKAIVTFTPFAYVKMLSLIQHFKTEVAWHGVVDKISSRNYLISDILVYPQTVTSGTANTDQEEYTRFMMGLDDDVYNRLHMQGHSHVNMSVTPSAVDKAHQGEIINQLGENDFYIFMIWNKSLSKTIIIYDMEENLRFDTDDVIIRVADNETEIEDFIKDATALVKEPTKVATKTVAEKPKKAQKKQESKKKKSNETSTNSSYLSYLGSYYTNKYYGDNAETDYDEYIFGTRGY